MTEQHPVVVVRRELVWSRIRWALFAVYLAAIVLWSVRHHVETGRVQLMSMAVVGVGISVIGRGWRAAGRLLLDWVPFALVLMLYDATRGLVTTLGVPVHEADSAHAEAWLFDGHIPAVWLQQQLYDPGQVHWYDALCTLVYTSHFIATPALAAVLWVRNRERWKAFVTRVIVLSLAGLITYTVFPEAPPWMASRDGYIGTVLRLSARGWEYLHVNQFHELVSRAQGRGSNPVAAMPSLHLAFSVIVAVAIMRGIRSRLRWLLLLYPAVMAFTLVYTGEHYVIDLIAGVVYAAAVEFSVPRVERWLRHRRQSPPPGGGFPG
ncbi:phosphatase PAP2 family protein [Flexivirga caeni]|uniref:Inositol phosphorylceramide synthase n=1 Tax=Flexivirga caeni TaxID=2294115 RepID=A0A3M9M825_9MICO|nr:phosphatase PAP2 family protein [Flexivirga caeni]RNI21626.1 inositol phosphorylceramide synthase [Flexivirga caeni]